MINPSGLEVRIARRQPSTPHRRLDGHTGLVTDLAVAALPDGRQLLISAGADAVAVVWDPVSGEQITHLRGHEKAIRAVSSFRRPDGTACVVTGGDDGTLRFWEPCSGQQLGVVVRGDVTAVRELVAWCDGTHPRISALVGTSQGRDVVCTVDAVTRQWVGDPIHGTGELGHLGVCELEGRSVLVVLASGEEEVSIQFWDAATGRPARTSIAVPENCAETMTVLPVRSGGNLLAVILDERVVLVDPTTGEFVGDVLMHPENQTSALTWFRTGSGELRLVSVISTVSDLWTAKFPSVTLWDPLAGEKLGGFPTGYLGLIECVVVLDGGLLAAACEDGSVRLWQLDEALGHRTPGLTGREGSGAPLHHVPEGYGPGLLLTTRDLQGLAGQGWLVDDDEYDLWDVASGELVGTLPGGFTEAVVHLGPGGRAMVLTVNEAGEMAWWEPRALTPIRSMPTDAEGYWWLHPEPGGHRVACRRDRAEVDVWDPATGRMVATIGNADPEYGRRFPDCDPEGAAWVRTGQGTQLVVCHATNLTLWDPRTGELRAHRPKDGVALTGLLLPGPDWLAVGDHEGQLRVLDAESLEEISTLATAEGIRDAAVLPDGRLATGSESGGIDLWNPRTGTHLAHHDLGVRLRGLAALPDSALAVGLLDGWIVVDPAWD
ncbi:MAG: hypothetical protein Q4D89_03650 [Arachnia propionica]|uniref:WD40 repeat domain-containing protein n=1 Tax=Arachnia propionica TaxID=1750 RepID=UPI0027117252|nr:hypothetical protein [Arachnia propionica]